MIPIYEFEQRVKNVQAEMAKEGYDYILAYGNEAEPQYVRYLSDYWPSFETAGVLVPAKGDAFLLIGPESYTYAADRSKLPKIRLLKAFRESSEPEYPGKALDTFESVFEEAGITNIKRFGAHPAARIWTHSGFSGRKSLSTVPLHDLVLGWVRLVQEIREVK